MNPLILEITIQTINELFDCKQIINDSKKLMIERGLSKTFLAKVEQSLRDTIIKDMGLSGEIADKIIYILS